MIASVLQAASPILLNVKQSASSACSCTAGVILSSLHSSVSLLLAVLAALACAGAVSLYTSEGPPCAAPVRGGQPHDECDPQTRRAPQKSEISD